MLEQETIQHKFRNVSRRREFMYDDILLAPGKLTDFLEKDIDFSTYCAKGFSLKLPIMSSPMDTVTEAELAIVMALAGGIGVLHYNYKTIDDQVEDAQRVKSFENGFIMNPLTLRPDQLVDEAAAIRHNKGISTIPIVDENNKLLGVLTKDDYSMKRHQGRQVQERMIPFDKLITASWEKLHQKPDPLDAANDELLDCHKSMLPVIDANYILKALVTRSDIDKSENYPNATKDKERRLRVFAAIEAYRPKGLPRADALASTVDGYVIDTAHGFTQEVGLLVEELKKKYAEKIVIAGNVSTKEGAEYLIQKGVDGIKVGTGPGSICTTQQVTGTGRCQASAVWECALTEMKLRGKYGHVPIIADGGIANAGDINKALGLGADVVMCGSLLAGTKEAPGEITEEGGAKKKIYRGMGSMEAMKQGSALRYGGTNALTRVPEGITSRIPYKGELMPWLEQIKQGMRQGFYKAGCRSIDDLHKYGVFVGAQIKKKE